jgi:hypothetical protein
MTVAAEAGREPSTSSGFSAAGFRNTIRMWLEMAFPTRSSGGFLCVIDNLELLETSRTRMSS